MIVIFTSLVAFVVFACVRVGARAEEQARNGAWVPTAKQRRAWKRERADLNPALRRSR